MRHHINRLFFVLFTSIFLVSSSVYAFQNNENWVELISRYEVELASNPNSISALKGLAQSYAYSGQYSSSLEVYNRLLELYPAENEARIGRARVYAWLGEYEKGEEDLRYILDKNQADAEAWHALGDLLLWAGKSRESAKAYTKWQQLEPDQPDAWLGAARANMSARRYGATWKDLRRARQRGANYAVINEMRRTLARVPNSHKWETGITGFYSYWEKDNKETGRSGQGHLRHDWSNGSVKFNGIWGRDSSKKEDIAASVELNIDIGWRSYLQIIGFQSLQDPDILPEHVLGFTWYQGLWRGLEVNGGFQYSQLIQDIFRVYSGGANYYLGRWKIGGQYLISHYISENNISFSFKLRRELRTVDDYLVLSYDLRDSIVGYSGLVLNDIDESKVYGAELQWFIFKHYGININIEYRDYKNLDTIISSRIGLRLRW